MARKFEDFEVDGNFDINIGHRHDIETVGGLTRVEQDLQILLSLAYIKLIGELDKSEIRSALITEANRVLNEREELNAVQDILINFDTDSATTAEVTILYSFRNDTNIVIGND